MGQMLPGSGSQEGNGCGFEEGAQTRWAPRALRRLAGGATLPQCRELESEHSSLTGEECWHPGQKKWLQLGQVLGRRECREGGLRSLSRFLQVSITKGWSAHVQRRLLEGLWVGQGEPRTIPGIVKCWKDRGILAQPDDRDLLQLKISVETMDTSSLGRKEHTFEYEPYPSIKTKMKSQKNGYTF